MSQDEGFRGAIRDNPDDETTRLIYADWLEEQGNPQGEFLRVQHALGNLPEGDERSYSLRARERQLLGQHGKGWAGPLRHLVRRYAFRRGLVEDVTLSAADFLERGEELLRLAPIRRVRLLNAADCLGELAGSPLLGRLLGLDLRHNEGLSVERCQPLLRSPHLAGLRKLCLRGTGLCNGPGIRALAACPGLTGLSELDLSDSRRDGSIGERRVARERGWGAVSRWRADTTHTSLDPGVLRALVESPSLGGLRTLRLGGYGFSRTSRETLAVLLGSRLLAGLTELDLSQSRFDFTSPASQSYWDGPTVLELLGRSPQAAGLRTLRLCRVGALGQEGSLSPLPHLAGLTGLELEDEHPPDNRLAALADGALPNLRWLRLRSCWGSPHRPSPVIHLARASGLHQLTALDLRETSHGPEFVRALTEEGSLLTGLRWLSLSNRGGMDTSPIGSEAACRLAVCPAAARLVHLDLTNNRLDDVAARALAVSPYLGQLATLILHHNDIGAAAAALASSACLPALTFLDLRSNPLSVGVRQPLRQRFGPGVRHGAGPYIEAGPGPKPEPTDSGEGSGEDDILF